MECPPFVRGSDTNKCIFVPGAGQKQISKFLPRETMDVADDPTTVSPQNVSTLLQVNPEPANLTSRTMYALIYNGRSML